MNKYSILIPIHNEAHTIKILLESLKPYNHSSHEIIVVDDGSTDGSTELLLNSDLITLITLEVNQGKGFAIKEGLKKAKYNKIIIFDGDMELHPEQISKLMILDRKNNINSVMGYRFKSLSPLGSDYDWGNFMFTSFFNIIFNSNHKDILCCAKSFYFNKKMLKNINSNSFDIDVELSSMLTLLNRNKKIPQIILDYKRRSIKEGKKLKISDGWIILGRIIKMTKHI